MFDGYWEDIGTIRSFYEANLMLAQPNPPFELASATAPITLALASLPRLVPRVTIERSLVADGCVIGARTRIENSVIGLRCRIGSDVTIRNSVIMGADYTNRPGSSRRTAPKDGPHRHRGGRDHRWRDRRQRIATSARALAFRRVVSATGRWPGRRTLHDPAMAS